MEATMTPEWWLSQLEAKLADRQTDMQLMNDFYTGQHPLPFVTKAHLPKIRNEFRELLQDSRSNFTGLVVDAVEERLRVEGIRLSASSDEQTDKASWDTWQANQMDSESQIAFVEALVKGVSYLSVWSPDDRSSYASIAVEDPLQTIVGYEPGSNFRRRAAALKVWKDDWTGNDRANVYLPDAIYKFEAAGTDIGGATVSGSEGSFGGPTYPVRSSGSASAPRWKRIDGDDIVSNPVGKVPIVALRNRPRLLCEGESELADVYRIQNQINGFLFLLALAGYFGAHRQRWMTGVSLFDDDNKPLEPFNAAIDRLWATENPDAKFGDFEQTNLDGYIKAIEQKVVHVAVTSRTPKHYLLPEGQEPSGDAIKSAEAGLVKKVQRKQRPFGEGLEDALRLARLFEGKADADAPVDSEIVWADPQIRSEAEITDASIKKFQMRLITWDQACQDMGYSPQAIARMLEAFGGVPPTPGDSTAAPETAAA
jgi:hypothetical protein